jgi:hypothetical protein
VRKPLAKNLAKYVYPGRQIQRDQLGRAKFLKQPNTILANPAANSQGNAAPCMLVDGAAVTIAIEQIMYLIRRVRLVDDLVVKSASGIQNAPLEIPRLVVLEIIDKAGNTVPYLI